MRIIFSASDAFCHWLKLDLPLYSSGGISWTGDEAIASNEEQLSLQLHAILDSGVNNQDSATVIAVEAHSNYAIIMPDLQVMPQADLEKELLNRWFSEMTFLMADTHALPELLIPRVQQQISNTEIHPLWYKASELSLNGQLDETTLWYREALSESGSKSLTMDEAFDLGLQINNMGTDDALAEASFTVPSPVTSFVDDGLYRFAKGLADFEFADTIKGNFPNPFQTNVVDAEAAEIIVPAADFGDVASKHPKKLKSGNVISLADYRRKKT